MIIGKIRFKLHIENNNKKILHQKVQGANPETNQSKIELFIFFLFDGAISFDLIFLIDLISK
jgi:hypothetical protein